MRKEVYTFDFDGTLTTKDTLLEFIRYARGTWGLLWGFLLHSPWLVLMKLGLYPNYRAKQRIFSYYFRGMTLEAFDDLCQRFTHDNRERLLRSDGLATLRQALADGARVLIVSASIDNWVRPFFAGTVLPLSSGSITVLGTQVEVEGGRLTGRFLTANCYGAEKVRRIQEVLTEPRDHYHITAFGDSRGDKEMLAFADEGHYKPWHKGVNSHITPLPTGGGAGGEAFRFCLVGGLATLIQYGIYLLLLRHVGKDLANTIGYGVSFVFNFFASTLFTFHAKVNAKHGAGFALSHLINYLLQMAMLNLATWLGCPQQWAPIPMFCVCIPTNFILVRFFLKR